MATPGVIGGTGCAIAGQQTFNFTNPVTGDNVVAQRVTSGHDKATTGVINHPNWSYGYDYKNVHTFANGPSFAGGYSTNVIAVPEAEMIGVDLELTWLASDRITFGLTGSYTHSEYTKDVFVIDPNDPQRPASLFDAFSSLINLKGKNMIRVPEFKAGSWAKYSLPLSYGRLDFIANFSWIDRVYFSVFERKDQSADPYKRFDLRVSWNPDERWAVSAFVNNVFDEIGLRQVEQYGATESVGYRRSGTPTDPRLVGLEVRYKIGAR